MNRAKSQDTKLRPHEIIHTILLSRYKSIIKISYDSKFVIIYCPKCYAYFAEMNQHFSHLQTQQNLDLDTSQCNLQFSSFCDFL